MHSQITESFTCCSRLGQSKSPVTKSCDILAQMEMGDCQSSAIPIERAPTITDGTGGTSDGRVLIRNITEELRYVPRSDKIDYLLEHLSTVFEAMLAENSALQAEHHSLKTQMTLRQDESAQIIKSMEESQAELARRNAELEAALSDRECKVELDFAASADAEVQAKVTDAATQQVLPVNQISSSFQSSEESMKSIHVGPQITQETPPNAPILPEDITVVKPLVGNTSTSDTSVTGSWQLRPLPQASRQKSNRMKSLKPAAGPLTAATHYCVKLILDTLVFKILMMLSLVIALFGGAAYTLLDIPDDPGNLVLDIIMTIVMGLFAFECIGTFLVQRSYRFSFFFWMDVLGTISMLFEISYLLSMSDMNTVVLRAARTAKLGSRVGRLLKLLKCLSYFFGSTQDSPDAKHIAQQLMLTLSTKISVLTIILVMLLPVFQLPLYPKADLSMQLWAQQLEMCYQWTQLTNTSAIFQTSVDDLKSFYADVDYFPYRIEGYSHHMIVGGSQVVVQMLHGAQPRRQENVVKHEGDVASIYFDFTSPNRIQAATEIGLIVFIIAIMIGMSFDVSITMEYILITPLERMLGVVRQHASTLYEQIREAQGLNDEQDEMMQGSEIEMLEAVLSRLAFVASVTMTKNVVAKQDMDKLDHDQKAVLLELMHTRIDHMDRKVSSGSFAPKTRISSFSRLTCGTSVVELNSWELDTLALPSDDLHGLVVGIFFQSELAVASHFTEQSIFINFMKTIATEYTDVAYHCWAHACDVLHTVFRLLCLSGSSQWLEMHEQYALLVAALCHDVGHFGRTNPFLVETKHQLALRYNDKSPLENMHCSTLFQVCSIQGANAFSKASKDVQREARAICIASILHTDNAYHFDMVKDISHISAMTSEICDEQAREKSLNANYRFDVLEKNKSTWLQLFLHLADVSNPLKPFAICKRWAWRILDEFFEQGDEEKQLGIPLGMLNDRTKINRPGSQHGFINFLVAPLVASVAKVFPMLTGLHRQMSSNLAEWHVLWMEDAKPSQEDIAKRYEDVSKMKSISDELVARNVGGQLSQED